MASKNRDTFPVLSAAAIEKIRPHGTSLYADKDTLVVRQGEPLEQFVIVESGRLAVELVSRFGTESIAMHEPGEFFGDVHLLSGRPSLVNGRMEEGGNIITVPRAALQKLMSTEAELGETLLRAFILRRIELLSKAKGDSVVIGSSNSVGTLRIRDFLTRNGIPYAFLDVERDPDVQQLLDSFNLTVHDVPVLLAGGGQVLKNPSDAEIAAKLGLNTSVDETDLRDVVIVGAGPAGLSAAVYAASEGLNTLVLETKAPGGQASSSSKIENYLGFPMGIAGLELAARAITQSLKFGAEVLVARSAVELGCSRKPYELRTTGGSAIRTRAVVIATGAQYRKLPLENLERFEGVGVYYGATTIEAQTCGDEEVVVVGGGNSAGQAAVFLSRTARHVHLLIRREHLADTMSRYLIQRIVESEKITLHPFTEIVKLEGDAHLERVTWRDHRAGTETTHAIRHVYLMTGAMPKTDWLQGCVVLDEKGFVKTGSDLTDAELEAAKWPLRRRPFLLETSLPSVFAVGDVRSGSVKRVASGVGEGSLSVHFLHQTLAEQ